jgi:hypothetical protein
MLAKYASMNSRRKKTLKAVFVMPTLANVEWAALESLLVAVGCEVVEGSGSRVTFVYKGHVESFHRPHPQKEAKRYQVEQARTFLSKIGVKP